MEPKDETIAITVALLAIGTVLQFFLARLHTPLIPDVITAFYCFAIILFRFRIREAIAIGIAGGFLSMLIPGSILAPANLISGPAGAYGCYYFYELFYERDSISPALATFAATIISGCAFVMVATIVVYAAILATFGTFGGFIAAYLPIIVITAALNAVIVQVLVLVQRRVSPGQPGTL